MERFSALPGSSSTSDSDDEDARDGGGMERLAFFPRLPALLAHSSWELGEENEFKPCAVMAGG